MSEESKKLSDLHLLVGQAKHAVPPEVFYEFVEMIFNESISHGISLTQPIQVSSPIEVIAWLHMLLCQCQDNEDNE